jgi:glycosyltransferase involved in cell wall biosynthesis
MTVTTPEVSVIIPTYNRQHFIGKAIDSVLNQTYKDYELIIVDDGSTDGTTEWIKKTYPDVRLVRCEVNRGSASVRNDGIRLATGEFIGFLDSDDEWEPGFLAVQVKALKENPEAVLSYCDYTEVKTDGFQFTHNLKPWRSYPNLTHQLLMDNIIHTMSLVVIRRETLLQAGLLNETLKISHDRELYLRLLYWGKIVHVPQSLVLKMTHQGNIVGNYRRWAKEVLMVLDIFFADERSQPYKHLEAEAKSHWSFKLAKRIWQEKRDGFFALQMIIQAMWFSPGLLVKRVKNKLKTAKKGLL